MVLRPAPLHTMRWQNKRMEPLNLNININQNKDKQTTGEGATGTSMATAKDKLIGFNLNRSNSVGNARGIIDTAGNVWQEGRSADITKKRKVMDTSFLSLDLDEPQPKITAPEYTLLVQTLEAIKKISRDLDKKSRKKYSSRNQGVGGDF